MTEVRIASYNVENLFARPRAFDSTDWSTGQPIVEAHGEFNALIAKADYSDVDRDRMRQLLVMLDIYTVNAHGAVRRKNRQRARAGPGCARTGEASTDSPRTRPAASRSPPPAARPGSVG